MPRKSYSEGRRYYYGETLEKYDERFLVCRDIGHHWIPSPHWEVTRGPGGRVIEYRRTSLCDNCEGQRTQFYDGEMYPVRNYYHHSNGYLMGKEVEVQISGRLSRLEQMRRHGLEIPQPTRRRRRGLRAV